MIAELASDPEFTVYTTLAVIGTLTLIVSICGFLHAVFDLAYPHVRAWLRRRKPAPFVPDTTNHQEAPR